MTQTHSRPRQRVEIAFDVQKQILAKDRAASAIRGGPDAILFLSCAQASDNYFVRMFPAENVQEARTKADAMRPISLMAH